ncbi:MAG: phosphoribosyltransferase domain-containing protein [Selenomonadaceae bacterium]|nr:phosphoribosyltransferase domain-containing protein [Selenomonadaceae bacterium]
MKIFSSEDVLRIAKRFKNTRRNYLLVNPLQGKHLPTKPSAALEMMNSLGKMVAEKFSSARLVIGFAETATAIGAVVAKNLSDECFYIQTTREDFNGTFVEFLEEHSHAPEQKLFAENLSTLINQTSEIIFVDDELSTGKTLLNIVRQLKNKFSALNDKKICAASIINRLSEENLAALAAENIFCVYLVKLEKNFDADKFSITSASEVSDAHQKTCPLSVVPFPLQDTRFGVKIGEYFNKCEELGNFIAENFRREKFGEVLILSTEEFMLPAIIVGRKLEENFSVVTHSTTRSPIGICKDKNYPIREGFKLRSFYDSTRTTFIYNLKFYDAAIIVTNAENFSEGLEDLISALNVHGVGKIFCAEVKNVRDL